MKNFTLDLSQLTVVPDASKGGRAVAGPRTPRSSTDRDVIETALEFGKPFNPTFGAALEVLQISKTSPTVKVVPSPTVAMTSKSSDLTLGIGLTGTAAMVAGINLSGGLYGSTTPEFGIFGTAGFVVGIVSGASGGVELTFVFGTPRDFSGPFVSFQASVGPKVFAGASVGASLLFSPGPPGPGGRVPLTFMGIAFNLTGGVSALPFSISVEWSFTTTIPLLK
ncbi:MAG: hypothetical protein LAP86_26895 [Acidobacteriia bacterium]|nr:hypothetical protein [Terriglobia bacterium]